MADEWIGGCSPKGKGGKGGGEVLGINRQSLKFCCSPKYPAITSPPFVAQTAKRQKCVRARQMEEGGCVYADYLVSLVL